MRGFPRQLLFVVVLAVAVLVVAVPVLGQSNTVSSPPGYVTKEGEQYAAFFGAYATQRYQIGDGHLRGSKIALTQLSLRHDCWDYDQDHGGLGRSWSQVTLALAESDLSRIQATFTANSLTTPTQVYGGQVRWPTFTGLPKNCPAPLGDGYNLRFPFRSSFMWGGQNDLLLDFAFQGGSLANTMSWGTSAIFYYLDSANQGTKTGMRLRFLGSSTCKDASQTSAALCRIGAEVAAASNGNNVSFSLGSQWTAPSKPVIKALGVVGSTVGTDIGACNRLYLAAPLFFDFQTAQAGSGFSFTFFPPLPWNGAFAGTTLWCQAAWEDSKSRQFRLTRAARGQIPMQPVPSAKLRAVEAPQLTGSGNLQDNHLYIPLVFYN